MSESIYARLLARLRSMYWSARLWLDARASGGRARLHPTVRLRVRVVFRGRGEVQVGPHVVLGDRDAGRPGMPVFLAPREPQTRIEIGPHSRVTNGVELAALERITIGAGCLIGAGARIMDADFHGIAPQERHSRGQWRPVAIGDNAWIGAGATVLKGVEIGHGAVIGAGAVVAGAVAAGAVMMGNPARRVSQYEPRATAAGGLER